MAKFLFHLPDQQLNQLRQLSENTGIPVAQYIRNGIDYVINNTAPCGVVMSGIVASGTVIIFRSV